MPSLGPDTHLVLRLRTPLEAYRAAKRALQRLTKKRLLLRDLSMSGGNYCTVGALYVSLTTPEGCAPEKCPRLNMATRTAITHLVDGTAPEPWMTTKALNAMVAANDRDSSETGEQRYARMLAWLDEQIADTIADPLTEQE